MMFFARGLVPLLMLLLPVHRTAAAEFLSVSQRPINAGSVPIGAQRVPFLAVTFESGCDSDSTVSELTVTHDGLGDSDDVERVYATDGGRRLTRGRRFDASGRTATLRFRPAMLVVACSAKTVTIVGDFSLAAASAGEHRLRVSSSQDIVADTPVRVVDKTEGVSGVATVRPASAGRVSVRFLDLTAPLRFGRSRTLARLQLQADGGADQLVTSITLTNDGKAADGDVKNVRIQNRKGEVLTATAASMAGDRVTLAFDPPLLLKRRDKVLLELKGDIAAGKRRTIRFVLEEPSDIVAADSAR